MSKGRIQSWLAAVVIGAGVAVAGVLGFLTYLVSTAETLHPNANTVSSVADSPPSPAWAGAVEEAQRVVRATLAEQNLPGVSVAVAAGGGLVWAEGFGWADLQSRHAITPGTRFRIGTASTVLTSAAVGLLLEQGRLDLDAPIQTYVPEFPQKPWPVTLRHLMGHVAGVRTDGGDEGPFGEHCEETLEGLRIFADRSLLFQPGTRYRYSSYGWILVSAAVERAAEEPFLRFMRRRVFEPLGMDDTKVDSATDPVPRQATSYFPRLAADPRYGLHLMRPIDLSCYAGAGAFVSTPSDLVRFGTAVVSGKLLRPATVDTLQEPQHLASGEQTGYGLGWDLETAAISGAQTGVVGHDGDVLGGTVASLAIFPEHGFVVSVVSNISYADTFSIATKVAQAFADRKVKSER